MKAFSLTRSASPLPTFSFTETRLALKRDRTPVSLAIMTCPSIPLKTPRPVIHLSNQGLRLWVAEPIRHKVAICLIKRSLIPSDIPQSSLEENMFCIKESSSNEASPADATYH